MTIYGFSILICLALLFFALYAFARRKMDFRYVLFWAVLSVFLLAVSLNIGLLERIAAALNIFYAPSLLFVAALVFVLAFIFYITLFISGITNRVIRLTQEVGLLKKRIEELESGSDEK